MFRSVSELDGAAATTGRDRMITAVRDDRVFEMGVSIMPRVIEVMSQGPLHLRSGRVQVLAAVLETAQCTGEISETISEGMPEVKVCQFVLFRQIMGGRDQQVPFLVTHVHEEDGTISGVAFSGHASSRSVGSLMRSGLRSRQAG